MPSDPKGKPRSKTEKASKSEKSTVSKKLSSRSQSESSSGRSSSKENDNDKLIKSYLLSHAGYLKSLILPFSKTTSIPPLILSIILLAIFMLLHLYLPLFIIPHLSALITLIIPIQNTANTIISEKGRKKTDAAQSLLYWIIYCLLGWVKGAIQVLYPNFAGLFALARTAILILVGGPWFGRAGLRPEQAEQKSSSERKSSTELDPKHRKGSDDQKKDQ
ncbi:uncharacterized protein L201_006744 [Kwoniella dendrophila CBS 6074]|uniref:Uncharacterized protein n=1 Tax=Kwoniella dendrophila CBS 6074 TaxID=1295534 RepID=A0AAX4K4M5_9TREE